MSFKYITLVLIILISTKFKVYSQGLDLGELLHYKGKYFKLNGGVNASSSFNHSNDIKIVRQPFSYIFNGNMNIQFMSWSIPFNFTYTNLKATYGYQNPFKINRISINPKYKWLTLHIGDNNGTISPYTLNGLIFTGGGFDIAPPKSKIKINALYGRFLKATTDTVSIPTYKRLGWGLKAEYTIKKHKIALSLFHAKDKINSQLLSTIYDESRVTPQENICMSFSSQSAINQFMDVNIEYSTSILTRDIRDVYESEVRNPFSLLIKKNATTTSFNAFKTNLNINTKKRKVTIGIEHVDPNYRSLGALYFNNDFENITLGITQSFLKKKLTANFNGGLQRDNLYNQKLRSTKRFVGSINMNYSLNKKINMTGSYSSFQTFSAMTSQFERINQPNVPLTIDTLTYVQLSDNASLNTIYKLVQNKISNQSLNLSLVWQKASNAENGYVKQSSGNQIVNSNISYIMQRLKSGLSITSSFNITVLKNNLQQTLILGPVASVSYKNKKTGLNTSYSFLYNESYINDKHIGINAMNRMSISTTIKKKHNLGMNASWMYRKINSNAGGINQKNITQTILATINYGYTF